MVCMVCMPIFHPFSISGWLMDVDGWFQHQAELDKQKALLQEKLQKRQALVRDPGYGVGLGQFGSGAFHKWGSLRNGWWFGVENPNLKWMIWG